MNSHKINLYSHSDFLNEKRQDPITGDLIVTGDEIVFCQECKSAFLKSSWEYLNETHCNQNKTLSLFPIKKTLNLKSKRQYFKASLHSISDWKQFDTQIKTLPWVLSSLDMKEYKKEKNNTSFTLGTFVGISFLLGFTWVFASYTNLISKEGFTIGLFFILAVILLVIKVWAAKVVEDTTFVVDKNNPIISIEKDQIIVLMPYKEQKVMLAKYKIEEIELIPKENDNYKLRVSYKGGNMFFLMNINQNSLDSLIETLYNWSNTVKIDLTKMSFGRNEVDYLYADLDNGVNSNLLLP